jgi:Pyruvate/2-oxoacid:ferredoxin oxidoreductase gamma subunit
LVVKGSNLISEITNILVVGTGGQGGMTVTEILAEAAIVFGHDVKKTEVAGMAQRGEVVSSHLRFGPRVLSPQITPGSAEVLEQCILKRSATKKPELIELNLRAFAAGRAAAAQAAKTEAA